MVGNDEQRARLEQVLREYLGVGSGTLHADDDGSFPVRYGSALYHVEVVEGDPVLVRVWSLVLDQVDESDALFRALNDINAATQSARIFWRACQLFTADEVPLVSLDVDDLRQACVSVGSLADWADSELQPRFGGVRAFRDESARTD